MDSNEQLEQKVYPTPLDAEGFFFENEEDEGNKILTKIYENGSKVKKTLLPGCNKIVVVREMKGKDNVEIKRYMGRDEERYPFAATVVSATVDGHKETYEFFEELKMKDFNRIYSMVQDLNF